ncbi:MAG TPA: beta-propeller fold lactonase family protein [Blastocatellia bacterium]|nr:beta-propeller fold lactonase family protein [Blastocatellia bacterium]
MRYLFMRAFALMALILAFTVDLNAQPTFVYGNNDISGPNSVSGFSVAANGSLTQLPNSPFMTGGTGDDGGVFAANSITLCSSINFLFAANSGSNNVSVFSINPTTGNLMLVPGSPFATGGIANINGITLAVTPDNRFLMAGNADSGNISVFSIGLDGSLTLIPGSPFPVIGPPISTFGFTDGMKVTPDGKFLIVATLNAIQPLSVFSISSSGALTFVPNSPFSAVDSYAGVEINCASNLLFSGIANGNNTSVGVFNISSDGLLEHVPGSPFMFESGANSNITLLSPDEHNLFISNQFSNSVTVTTVAPDGSLSLVPGSPFTVGANSNNFPIGMATNREGTLLFAAVSNFGSFSGISVLKVNSNGTLSLVPGSPFLTTQFGVLQSISVFPPRTCGGQFNICLRDDSNGNLLRFNSVTGEYQFTDCGKGVTLGGKGVVTTNGCKISLTDSGINPKRPDRNVQVTANTCTNAGSASVRILPSGKTFGINDSNISGHPCSCP